MKPGDLFTVQEPTRLFAHISSGEGLELTNEWPVIYLGEVSYGYMKVLSPIGVGWTWAYHLLDESGKTALPKKRAA